MYKIAFANRNLGYGSALAILIMLLSLIFPAVQKWNCGKLPDIFRKPAWK